MSDATLTSKKKSVPPNHSKDDYSRMARLIMGEWEWTYEAGAYAVRRRSDKHLAWSFSEQDYAVQLCKNLNAIAPAPETSEQLPDQLLNVDTTIGSVNGPIYLRRHARIRPNGGPMIYAAYV